MTNPSSDVLERVARALFVHNEGGTIGQETADHWFNDADPDCKLTADDYRAQASAAIAAMPTIERLSAELERAAATERQAIVSWVRAIEATGKRGPWPRGYADAIERGEHIASLTLPPTNEGIAPKAD